MIAERGSVPEADGREIRLEGASLFLAVGLVLAALLGAFYVGRWVERRGAPGVASARVGESGRSVVEQDPIDVGRDTGVFDSPREGTLEPRRQAGKPSRGESDPAEAEPVDSPGGPWEVQVFAGRDRTSAESLVRSLRAGGYPVRLRTAREGRETLYRVRVVGYDDRTEAETAAKTLQEGGYGAWVIAPD